MSNGPGKVLVILQARMGSTRMPGKVLTELVPGKTLLTCLLDRLKQCRKVDEIVVATTESAKDDQLVLEAAASGARIFRGSETDVLGRFVGAVGHNPDAVVVRLCADSPLHDAEVVDLCVEAYLKRRDCVDYVSNMHPESYPYGMAVEVFPYDVLLRLNRMTKRPELREHVTSLVYYQPQHFSSFNVVHSSDLSKYRFAVDYPEDFQFARAVYERLYPDNPLFSWRSVMQLLDSQSELREINAVRNDRLQPAES